MPASSPSPNTKPYKVLRDKFWTGSWRGEGSNALTPHAKDEILHLTAAEAEKYKNHVEAVRGA